MSTKEQSVTLLRKNKLAQVKAFQSVGMSDVNESTRASEFADRIKWAAGLYDICLACKRISDGTDWYFTKEEWNTITNSNKALFVKRGLRIRAFGHSFVLAAQDCTTAEGDITMPWSNKVNVSELTNRLRGDAYRDFKGLENTELIIAQLSGTTGSQNIIGAPAAECAKAYKAFTAEYDGIEDTSDWHLPALGVCIILYRIKPAVQEALAYFWSYESKLAIASLWSSTELDAENAWYVSMSSGVVSYSVKDTKYRVRAVCDVM